MKCSICGKEVEKDDNGCCVDPNCPGHSIETLNAWIKKLQKN